MNHAFDTAFIYLLKHDEGVEYVNDPTDSGGPTKFGITQRAYEHYVGHTVSVLDIKEMTPEVARKFYFDAVWKPLSCDLIKNLPIAICIFDLAVLYGNATAAVMAQKALSHCGANLKLDGIIGPQTLRFLNISDPDIFLTAIHDQILVRIDFVVSHHPKDEKYRAGWVKRADRLLALNDKKEDEIV